jgi:hypothetical protein
MTAPLTVRSDATEIVLRPDAEVDTGGTSCAPVSAALVFSMMPPPVPPIEEQAAASITTAVAAATLAVLLK